jgi:hypothetical protein
MKIGFNWLVYKDDQKKIKSINPVAKSRTTGEHGPAAISIVHKNKKKYSRKSKHKKIKFS